MNNTSTTSTNRITDFERVYHFLNYCYFNKNFKLKRECRHALDMMNRYRRNRHEISEMQRIMLNNEIETAKRYLRHPEWAKSECSLCGILEDIEEAFM